MIAFIEDQEAICKILTQLGLWQIKARPRPVACAPSELAAAPLEDWPAPSAEDYLTDPLYPYEVKILKTFRSDEAGFARKQAKTKPIG